MLDPITLLVVLIASSIISGLLGSLTGLGGASFLIPIYIIFLGFPAQYATGASLVATSATSSGAASAYVKDRITNIRIAMGLESGTTLGAILGALAAGYAYSHSLQFLLLIILGSFLLSQVFFQISRGSSELPKPMRADWTTKFFQLKGVYYDYALKREVSYYGVRWWLSAIIMFIAGFFSGLLGVGGGEWKVLALDWAMNFNMKV